MKFNLKTTMRATPKLSSSILSNYVTKEELKNASYVQDVGSNELDKVYGRQQGGWVEVKDIDIKNGGLICMGISAVDEISATNVFDLPIRKELTSEVKTYKEDIIGKEKHNLWICSTKEIDTNNIKAFNVDMELISTTISKQETIVEINTDKNEIRLNCYKVEGLSNNSINHISIEC